MLLDLVIAELFGLPLRLDLEFDLDKQSWCLLDHTIRSEEYKTVIHLVRLELGLDQTLDALDPGLDNDDGGPPLPPGLSCSTTSLSSLS